MLLFNWYVTRGHRFLGADEITIKNAASYVDTLKENFVMVDQDARRELISKQLHDMAASKNASIVWDDDLLEEINYLLNGLQHCAAALKSPTWHFLMQLSLHQ